MFFFFSFKLLFKLIIVKLLVQGMNKIIPSQLLLLLNLKRYKLKMIKNNTIFLYLDKDKYLYLKVIFCIKKKTPPSFRQKTADKWAGQERKCLFYIPILFFIESIRIII